MILRTKIRALLLLALLPAPLRGGSDADMPPLSSSAQPIFKAPPSGVARMSPLETRRQTANSVVYPVDEPGSWSASPVNAPTRASLSPSCKLSQIFPVFLNAIPLIFERRAGHTRRDAVLNFLYSQGFASTPELFEFHLLPAIAEMEKQVRTLEEAAGDLNKGEDIDSKTNPTIVDHHAGDGFAQLSAFWKNFTSDKGYYTGDTTTPPEWLATMRSSMPITMAVGVHQQSFVLCFKDPLPFNKPGSTGSGNQYVDAYIREQALSFLSTIGTAQPERQAKVLDALLGQMSVRVRLRDEAWRGFFSAENVYDKGKHLPDLWNWTKLEASYPRARPGQTFAELRARQVLSSSKVPVWVLNMWRSPVRRLHMRREIEREGLHHEAKLFHSVDGLALSDMTIEHVIAKGAVMSTGEIGCFMTHLTAWREVERQALPFAVILEDDAQLKPGFRRKLYAMLNNLATRGGGGGGWDVLFLEECSEMRAHGEPDQDCRDPYVGGDHNLAGLLDIGADKEEDAAAAAPMCVPSGVRAYAVSQRGARRLAAAAVPIRWAIDVFMGEMIYARRLHAYCTVPSLAGLHPGGAARSDTESVPVFHTKTESGQVAYTADPRAGFPSCDSILCVLHFGLSPEEGAEEGDTAQG